jgi:hypothetical protein
MLKFGKSQFYIPPLILNSKSFRCDQLRKPYVCSPVNTKIKLYYEQRLRTYTIENT